MPSGQVVDTLPSWTRNTKETLQYLSLICKASPLVTWVHS